MPSSSPELLKMWGGERGVADDKAVGFLIDRGYELTKGWFWKAPKGLTDYTDMPYEEYDAIMFLIQEWDYGEVKFGMARAKDA